VQRHVQMAKDKKGFPALSAPTRQERRRNARGGGQDNVAVVGDSGCQQRGASSH
jgi:hypothetical protein